ncbi:MAG: hypothetical protein DDG59_04135 [Anaerolineae bacterium]|jgi:hypothetical protein|nr:MAG: hypothetical protein DDG59_04135 [Anaerolineae bacterium]
MHPSPSPKEELNRIIESARRLGVEIDEEEALQWLTAMAAVQHDEITVDARHGVYGHKVSLLDFTPEDLAHFRQVGQIVEIPDQPGVVETALALSGSAAQSKIQTYPGDCDYFERVNIKAPSKAEACRILGETLRQKVLSTASGDTYRFIEVKLGSYPFDGLRDGKPVKKGAPISWSLADVQAAQIVVQDSQGNPNILTWEEMAQEPGWTKLDWVIACPPRKQLANASNNLDVTWEAPDGTILPLDGQLDPYFQEVYLEAESIPLFTKLAKQVAADAMDQYVEQLEKEVKKYVTKSLNYGKAAKRMYNVFRLKGLYSEAAYLRELFDEPATILYQISALVRTVDEASASGSEINQETITEQLDELILGAIEVLEGAQEKQIVRRLLRLRTLINDPSRKREQEVLEAQAELMDEVNAFFYDRLMAVQSIRTYIETLQQ